jgi:hypothetical protein
MPGHFQRTFNEWLWQIFKTGAPMPIAERHGGASRASLKRGCEGFILGIVAAVRRDYDLPAQPLMEAIARLLIGREGPF